MTNKQILNLTETLLREEEDFLIPVFKIHELILQEHEGLTFEVEELISLLVNDQRFVIVRSDSTQEPWNDEDDDAMKALGYYKGPRVMLKSKVPEKAEMIQAMSEKMEETLHALKTAYKVKPDNLDDDQEEELLRIMQKTKDLQKKINDDITKKD